MQLQVSGRLSDTALTSKCRLALDYRLSKAWEVVVLCELWLCDIPLGYGFSRIEDVDGQVVFKGLVVLKKLTQQFVLPFDALPKGWKTICKFELAGKWVPKAIRSLPAASYWVNEATSLVLRGDFSAAAL